MRPTARGGTVFAVVIASISMSWQYGPRALNAVVTPLVVILVAGLVTTTLAGRPRVRRAPVSEGFVGDTRTVTVTVESARTHSATIEDAVDDGLTAIDGIGPVTLDGTNRFAYELSLDERGAHRIGPLSIVVTDLFGLFRRRFTYDESASVVVYPQIHDLNGESSRALATLGTTDPPFDRERFDHLREYHRGDSLRDVNWKAAAKRPDSDLIVTEYVNEGVGSVTIAGGCTPTRDDELATAVGSLAIALLEMDASVGLALPGERIRPAAGADHRGDLLQALAVLEPGELTGEDRERADILVSCDSEGCQIVSGDRTIPFAQFRLTERQDEHDTDRVGRADSPCPTEATS